MGNRAAALGLGMLALGGCGLPLPYSPQRLAADSTHAPARALVHYLQQPDPLALGVCDPTAPGPHLATVDVGLVDRVTRAFLHGEVPPAHWSGCLAAMWRGAPDPVQAHLAATAVDTFTEVLAPSDQPTNLLIVRLAAVRSLVGKRPPDARLPTVQARAALQWITAHRAALPAEVQAIADQFAEEVGLDLGLWKGQPVDARTIAGITDEVLLARFATRLPDAALRKAARARIVRLRIAASPWAAVRDHADEVVGAVLKTGHWAVPLDRYPVQGIDVAPGPGGAATWLVVQDPAHRTAHLRVRLPDGTLRDGLDLAGRLRIHLKGMEQPVGPCPRHGSLDPLPCVPLSALTADAPLVDLDSAGRLAPPAGLQSADVLRLARLATLSVPITVAGQHADLVRPLRFDPPQPLVLQGPAAAKGPALVVRVRTEGPGRLVYEVQEGGTTYHVVVERADLRRFRVVSQGGAGVPGAEGRAGAPGQPGEDGMDAFCPNSYGANGGMGGPGDDGRPGGPGGKGGDGGEIQLYVACGEKADCSGLIALVTPTVQSLGGPGGKGGKGGPGGPGGPGGRGGRGMGCVVGGVSTYLQDGRDGLTGSAGNRGPSGADGASGRPGSVHVQVVP